MWESLYSRTLTPSRAVVHKVKIHFFLYFSCDRRSVGISSSGWTAADCKRIFLVPDHIWPKTIKGQPALTHVIRNYVLLLVVPPLCLWWVTHTVTKALRLKILPGQQLPLFPKPPPPPLLKIVMFRKAKSNYWYLTDIFIDGTFCLVKYEVCPALIFLCLALVLHDAL